MAEFIHLHNHSHYSLLDGAATVDGLIEAAVKDKMPSLALTDHGVMFGAVEFYKAAKKAGIKPILGCEVYIVTRGSRFDRTASLKGTAQDSGRGVYNHLVLLAKNAVGYHNLIKLTSLGFTEGFYYKPRIDIELLRQYREGLIALSACPAGPISSPLIKGEYEAAKQMAIVFKEMFGDDFYLEIQDHRLATEKPILEGMPLLAKELNVKLIATNDVHYVNASDDIAHNVMLHIPEVSTGMTVDYKKLRYETNQIYFKTQEEMCNLFRHYKGAIESTLEVADKIEQYEIGPKTPFMPNFPIPPDAGVKNLNEYLTKLANEGIVRRYPKMNADIQKRLEHELAVITKMGYSGYFLITQDFINAAKRMGVSVGPGRGSAAGSIVSYALGITDVDPLKYDLLFERFLNPDRVSMPDIDVDFSDTGRDRVINYVKEKYGEASVSQIITFGTLSSRAVIKDVGRVLGIPLSTCDSITKQIPVFQGKVTPIAEAIDTLPDLKWVKDSQDDKIKELVEIAETLEGMNRNASTHAAGVVIAPGPITDYVPIFKSPQGEAMTQYSMDYLEQAGLLKMDFLGLRTLSIIEKALKQIERTRGIVVDLDTIPENDPATFELFTKGHTIGIFQFESGGMTDWLRKLKPTTISDLVAMNALYRPGPMDNIGDFIKNKFGDKIQLLHPALEPILRETYGIIVYQEQVMRIASEIAGFTLAKSDLMRRAMGKKDKELMEKQKVEFISGAVVKGFTKDVAGSIFDMILKFASYGFNKSHSVAYSIIAYRTAYLKANFTPEYLAACMTAEFHNTDSVAKFIEECRKQDIQVLPPDVNEGENEFVVTPKGIRFGLSAIKGVGESAVDTIIKYRQIGGPYKNIFDFCSRVELRSVNKKTIEALIQAGAFDTLHDDRARLFAGVEKAIQYGQASQGNAALGQDNLFGGEKETKSDSFPTLPEAQAWHGTETLTKEREVLGFYISGHPLRRYQREVEAFSTASLGDGEKVRDGTTVRVCGVVVAVRKKVDKKGNTMAFLTLQDFSSKGECIVFSDAFKKYAHLLTDEACVLVMGKAEQNGDTLRIFVNDVVPLDQARQRFMKSVMLTIDAKRFGPETVLDLKKLLEKYKGRFPCVVNVVGANGGGGGKPFSMPLQVDPTDQFFSAAEKLFGPRSTRILA